MSSICQLLLLCSLLLISLTNWGSHAIALWIYQASNLCEVAVALADVLDAGRLHQKSIICGEDPLNPLPVVFHQGRVFPATHECPHFLVSGNLRFLWNQNKDVWRLTIHLCGQHSKSNAKFYREQIMLTYGQLLMFVSFKKTGCGKWIQNSSWNFVLHSEKLAAVLHGKQYIFEIFVENLPIGFDKVFVKWLRKSLRYQPVCQPIGQHMLLMTKDWWLKGKSCQVN